MKIRELIRETGVPRQTIHYYIQSGLLPRPRKLGVNSAEYSQLHIDRIKLIKDLQESCFLPLSVIRKLFRKYMGKPENRSLLEFKGRFFRPEERLMSGDIKGEAAFIQATGLSRERLADYESWEIITPCMVGGEKHYSFDDQIIARIIAHMRTIGLTSDKGFPPEILKWHRQKFQELVDTSRDYFFEAASQSMSTEDISTVGPLAMENLALFFYHLYHKLSREALEDMLTRMKKDRRHGGPDGEDSQPRETEE